MTLPDNDGSPCKDADKPHILWYMLDDQNDPVPVPYSLTYDTQQDALDMVRVIIDKTVARPHESLLIWAKVFRADNEAYTCFQWNRPSSLPPTPSYRQEPPEVTMQIVSAKTDTRGRSLWRRLLGR